MSDFKIEKNVPLVDGRSRQKDNPFPFENMEIGDSFTIPVTVESINKNRALVNNWVRKFRKQTGLRSFNVATRIHGQDMRVWRTA